MTRPFLAGAFGLALLSTASYAQAPVMATPAGGTTSPIDRQFEARAAASNTFEIRSSEMALRRSHDPAVRDLARWMIESHTAAAHALAAVADTTAMPETAGPVETPETNAMLAELAGLQGADFDRAYVSDQVSAHALTAQQMSDYAVQGSYAPLLRYEAMTRPEVEQHLAHFRALDASMSRPL